MYFSSFNQVIYFTYIVGKSTPFSILSRSMVSLNFPIFRGYGLFLPVTAHSIFTFKIFRDMQSYPDSNEPVSLQMSSFVCVFICPSSSHSPSPLPLVVDASLMLMISLTPL